MKKWVKIVVFTILGLGVLFGILGFSFYKRFVAKPPKMEFPPPADLQEAQRQDLEYLSLYPDVDRSFNTDDKLACFFAGIERLESRLPVTEAVFELEVAKIVACADNAHTNVSPGSRARRMNAVPLRFFWFAEGLHVVMAQPQYRDVLGKRVISINGNSPAELLKEIKPSFGGAETSLRDFSPLYFMSPQVLNAMGLGAHPDSLQLTLASDSIETTLKIAADSTEQDIPGYYTPNWLNPGERIDTSEWLAVDAADKLPMPVLNIKDNVHHLWIEDLLYVQVNENWNSEERKVRPYLEGVINEMQQNAPSKVVLDLRFNVGGDYHLVRPFIEAVRDYLAEEQKMYVITGHGTFSAGLITAAVAKAELGDKAIFIGEPMGDRLQFWADGGLRFTLPNSKIYSRIWRAYHDWENGCKDFSKCFWFTVFDGVAAGKIEIDVPVSLSFNDYLEGTDSALERIRIQ